MGRAVSNIRYDTAGGAEVCGKFTHDRQFGGFAVHFHRVVFLRCEGRGAYGVRSGATMAGVLHAKARNTYGVHTGGCIVALCEGAIGQPTQQA